ncbi:MAG: trypsin-like peptidase domain-containing protein [Sphingomonas sp.]|uniref:S1C family serine protease n=1 Tax=Sphingomonas sp. TaxID=28214 RepID=UPI001B1E27B0|nr:trypsin-like peptidase domain-containing protein [Sphingomonas sp.]MBO9624482.1 trypsin-like peptidase domain-containing protein [Sphingomonas sp.]
MRRLLMVVALVLAWAAPARADDISAAGRGVVRIVTIAVVDDEVVGFGHGSGFAVAPNRIVTNAHVVELADRYPDNVVIGVVPSEGDKSYQGRLIAIDQQRDLALIEFSGVRLPPLTLFSGAPGDGDSLIALGYPGNVDLATARSAADFITPQSPVRSQGGFAGLRTLQGTNVLLHTASIARGNSGGPLLDRCGRVLGVNSAITRADEGDSTFAFAIAGSELAAFLANAKQPVATVGVPCTSVEEQMAAERSADEKARLEAEEQARIAAAEADIQRRDAIAQARARNEVSRENRMAIAALMLVLGGVALAGGGLLLSRDRRREAAWVAAGGVVLILGAAAVFLTRPGFDESKVLPVPVAGSAAKRNAPIAAAQGRLQCTLVPERSRVTVTAVDRIDLDIGADGCINGRTQYAEAGTRWQRILVPENEQSVSVLEFDPVASTYTNTRFLLSAEQMARARQLRATVPLKSCSADQAARAALASQQQALRAALPTVYNEKLVYSCKPAAAATAAADTRDAAAR